MKYLSVCSGMEAASVAWHPLGWTPVGFSEIEPFPCAILKHRFPNTPNYGDLTKYNEWPLSAGDVDLLAGGPPCQAFSVAGLRRGLADPRGNLTLTYLGLVDKLQPKYVVYENVPGLLSVDGGTAFGSFLGGLAELGYSAAWRVLDAQYVGSCRLHPHERGQSAVPQRRRRVFVVAVRGAGNWQLAAEVLSISEGMRGHTPSRGKKGQGVAAGAEGGVDADGMQRTVGTLCADTHPGAYSGQDAYTGRLIPQPFTASSFGQYADGVGTVRASGGDLLGDKSGALSSSGGTHQTNYIAQPKLYENHPNDSRVTGPHDVSPTVVSRFGTGGGNVPLVNDEIIAFQPGNLRREAGADPSSEVFPTLTKDSGDQSPHVAHPVVPLDGMNLLSRLGDCGENHSMQNFEPGDPSFTLRKGGVQHGILTPMAVRRLTPVETERLQGFPDNWSRIPWKGKPEEQCPDGPRYKACGNSMAVPVMRWIGERIQAVESSQPHA